MSRRILAILALAAVFGAGFFCGVLWNRTRTESTTIEDVVESIVVESPGEELTEEERRMEEALKDPDFKKVHDFLMREQGVKMELPERDRKAPELNNIEERKREPFRFDQL